YSPPETGLVVPVFQKEDHPIDAINHMMSFLTAVVTSRGGKILYWLVRQDRSHQDQVDTRQAEGNYVLQLQRRGSHVQAVHKTQDEVRCRKVQG
nr:hypothetical protein [Tanacetum cinerariifolium]